MSKPGICEPNLRHSCPAEESCSNVHHHRAYLWQVKMDSQSEWRNLENEGEILEKSYQNPYCDTAQTTTIATGNDGNSFDVGLCVDLQEMEAKVILPDLQSPPGTSFIHTLVTVRRLSTPSYADKSLAVKPGFSTLWRWYYHLNDNWILFPEKMQPILERKHVHGQEIYRFEGDASILGLSSVSGSGPGNSYTFLVDLKRKAFTSISYQKHETSIRRRPLMFTEPAQYLGKHHIDIKDHPFGHDVPENWVPMAPDEDYELVPLNPDSMEYHLVASEFHRSIPNGRAVVDVFRVQNPFLWHKFASKKRLMETKKQKKNEKQLFHGTGSETAVQCICKQNFDWRVCGKNNIKFGKGSYFAKDAAFSDSYSRTGAPNTGVLWMFLARVLVGRHTIGNKLMNRPPPIDPCKPHGDYYDSTVESNEDPRIFVIYDSDQCYPEYLFSYRITR